VARPWLAGAVAVGVGQAILLVAQADLLARLLADALYGGLSGHAAVGDGLRIALLAVGRGVLGWAWEACTEAAARRARPPRGGGRWRRPSAWWLRPVCAPMSRATFWGRAA
jgi:hypothetical protein